jgi:dTDP-4-dehydrorhamnose reductase
VTVWALLGSFDWDSLVTRMGRCYEPGAFDLRTEPPQLTPIGQLTQAIVAGAQIRSESSQRRPWWHTTDRLFHNDSDSAAASGYHSCSSNNERQASVGFYND